MAPLRDHEAPRPFGASHTVSTPPPVARTRLIFPSAKNPIQRLSGDQNGLTALSVPGIGRPSRVPSGRSQSWTAPDESEATATRLLPSGEIAQSVASPPKFAPTGS